jgi:hypothetical protein
MMWKAEAERRRIGGKTEAAAKRMTVMQSAASA